MIFIIDLKWTDIIKEARAIACKKLNLQEPVPLILPPQPQPIDIRPGDWNPVPWQNPWDPNSTTGNPPGITWTTTSTVGTTSTSASTSNNTINIGYQND